MILHAFPGLEVAGREAAYSTHFLPRSRISGAIPPFSHICLHDVHMDKASTFPVKTAGNLKKKKKIPLIKGAERPSAADGNQTASAASGSNIDHDSLKHGTPLFLWAVSWAARRKVTVRGTPNRLNYCVLFTVDTHFTNVAAGRGPS